MRMPQKFVVNLWSQLHSITGKDFSMNIMFNGYTTRKYDFILSS